MTTIEETRLQLKTDDSLAEKSTQQSVVLPSYKSILIAADASDHSNRGVSDAVELGSLWQSTITGVHVYAAKMHDTRFRQMEGGLPEKYQEETELEKQRDIHDALITKGLSAITDSYLDQVAQTCQQQKLSYRRCALEGKNYRELLNEANNGDYDLLIMGALGLGAVASSRIGTVCERVARRSNIDCLIIKDPKRPLNDGPIVVAIDGSTRAYGGLLTGLSLAKAWGLPLKVISAFDPYYHYVAFNRIAGVLSEEAGKIFRFKEQEQLHEDIIDAGLAKIYQGHLDVAEGIAKELGVEISTTLLDGKPYEAIEKYLQEPSADLGMEPSTVIGKERKPSLLIMGKLGIHADNELDIGGNAENLLRNVSCSVWLSQRHYQPRIDMIAEASCSWTKQAEQRINKVPEFARGMARLGVLRYAQEQGHTVITKRIVQEATRNLCPAGFNKKSENKQTDDGNKKQVVDALKALKKFRPDWSAEAKVIANNIIDPSLRDNLIKRAEKKARQAGSLTVQTQHIHSLVNNKIAKDNHGSENKAVENSADKKTCPFGFKAKQTEKPPLHWNEAALLRLQRIPEGFMRNMTRQRVESFTHKQGLKEVTEEEVNNKYQQWAKGSSKQEMTMTWSLEALTKIERIPDFVRGMVIKEVERCAQNLGAKKITLEQISKVRALWASHGAFHFESNSVPMPTETKIAPKSGGSETVGGTRTNDLYLLAINLTQRCNLSCAHCYLNATPRKEACSEEPLAKNKELSCEEVCKLLDSIARRSNETMVVLTGGEPLMRTDLETIAKHGADLGLAIVIGTNGTLLTKKRIRNLKQAGVLGVGISLDSLQSAQHDRFRGQPGCWKKTMEAIENCQRLELSFQIHFTITQQNHHELPAMIQFCRDQGARVLNVFFLICTGRGESLVDISQQAYEKVLTQLINAQAAYPELIIRPRCAPHFKRIAHQLNPQARVNLISGHEGDGCIAATHYCRITPKGEVTPCPYIDTSAGSIRQQDFWQIWDHAPIFAELRHPKLRGKCGRCEYRELCGGCRARPIAEGKSIMDEDPLCNYQPQPNPQSNTTAIIKPWQPDNSTIVWSSEAEKRLGKIPGFIRKMVKNKAEAYVQEKGAVLITCEHLNEMTAQRFGKGKPQRPSSNKGSSTNKETSTQ